MNTKGLEYIEIDGMNFKRHKTGYFRYYLRNRISEGGNGKRYTVILHRYLYEKFIGQIPKGFHIHHKDFDKDNNDISNLQLLSNSEHIHLHSSLPERIAQNKKTYIDNPQMFKKAQDIWREHLKEKIIKICTVCGKEYSVSKIRANSVYKASKYCGRKCHDKAWYIMRKQKLSAQYPNEFF